MRIELFAAVDDYEDCHTDESELTPDSATREPVAQMGICLDEHVEISVLDILRYDPFLEGGKQKSGCEIVQAKVVLSEPNGNNVDSKP